MAASNQNQEALRSDMDDATPLRVHHKPHVLVVGGSRISKQLQSALEQEEIIVAATASVEIALETITKATVAIILVPPIAKTSLLPVCKVLIRRSPDVPLFVASGPMSQETLAAVYKVGVEAVFFWPGDRDALVQTIFRISGAPVASLPSKGTPQEMALEELVAAHLLADPTAFGKRLRVRVRNRFVMLLGHIDALWKIQIAERIAGEVPGVKDVFHDGVIVTGANDLSDRNIASAARQVLKYTGEVDSATLAVAVKDGCATLTGTATNRAELVRAMDLISHVRGVKKLTTWVVVDAKRKRKDHLVADAIRDAAAVRHPGAKIDIAVFGGVAVLSGTVASFTERTRLNALAHRQKGVQRVVDKLKVRAGKGK